MKANPTASRFREHAKKCSKFRRAVLSTSKVKVTLLRRPRRDRLTAKIYYINMLTTKAKRGKISSPTYYAIS